MQSACNQHAISTSSPIHSGLVPGDESDENCSTSGALWNLASDGAASRMVRTCMQSACTQHALSSKQHVISMQSACTQHALSMQSACNQHAISMQSAWHSSRTQHALSMHSACTQHAISMQSAWHSSRTHHALSMHSACTQHALSTQSACNQHAILVPACGPNGQASRPCGAQAPRRGAVRGMRYSRSTGSSGDRALPNELALPHSAVATAREDACRAHAPVGRGWGAVVSARMQPRACHCEGGCMPSSRTSR